MRSHHILKTSFQLTCINVASSFVGFLTNALLASIFGAGVDVDAFFVSQTIPLLIQAMFSAASNFALIPAFGDLEAEGNRKEIIRTSSILLIFFATVLSVISLALYLFSETLIDWTAPGLAAITRDHAITLLRIQSPLVLSTGIASLLSSMHSARKNFLFGPIANFLGAVTLFSSILLLHRKLGIKAAAVGVITNSLIVFLVLLVPQLKAYPFQIVRKWRGSAALIVIGLMLPLLGGSLFYRADNLVQRFVASSFPAGSISYLGYGQKIMTLFSLVLGSGMPVVALSNFSSSVREKNQKELSNTFTSVFRWMAFLSVGCVLLISVVGIELVQILFMRGKFDETASIQTNQCLFLYSGVLVGGVLGGLVTPVFYANKDVKTTVTIGISGALLQFALSFILPKYFSFLGLPVAFSIASLASVGILYFLLSKKHLDFELISCFRFLIICVLCCSLASALTRIYFTPYLIQQMIIVRLTIKSLVAVVLYAGFSFIVGVLHILADEHPRLKKFIPITLFRFA